LGLVALEELFVAFAGLLRQNGEIVLLQFGQSVFWEHSVHLHSLWGIFESVVLVSVLYHLKVAKQLHPVLCAKV